MKKAQYLRTALWVAGAVAGIQLVVNVIPPSVAWLANAVLMAHFALIPAALLVFGLFPVYELDPKRPFLAAATVAAAVTLIQSTLGLVQPWLPVLGLIVDVRFAGADAVDVGIEVFLRMMWYGVFLLVGVALRSLNQLAKSQRS